MTHSQGPFVPSPTPSESTAAAPRGAPNSDTEERLRAALRERYELGCVPDDALHETVKKLVGRHNVLTADLLAHLGEVDARGIYRERACSSLHTYCVYELRFSEDEAQRRSQAARTARRFPVLFEMLADGAIHMTGLLLLAPHLTPENNADLLARARFRTKREIERLVAEVSPRVDVPSRIEPLGPGPKAFTNLWQAYTASLRGSVRELDVGTGRGQAPAPVFDASEQTAMNETDRAKFADRASPSATDPLHANESEPAVPLRYRIEFTVDQDYVDRLEEARDLLQHQVPNRDVARIHELAMASFVERLRKRRGAASRSRRRIESEPVSTADDGSELDADESVPERISGVSGADGSAPERISQAPGVDGSAPERISESSPPERSAPERMVPASRQVPVAVRRHVWARDGGRCTFSDARGRRCRERSGLEVHHEHAFALGGPTTVENLRLVCRAHNALFAERDFGQAHIERMRSGGRAR